MTMPLANQIAFNEGRPTKLRFSFEDAFRAHEEWGANCGPGALAAIMGMTLDEIRPHMGDFERKHYTNPTLMKRALQSIGRPWRSIGPVWPNYGLALIQWEGPWTEPSVPIRVRYRYTHWIGTAKDYIGRIVVFDINCIIGAGWVFFRYWKEDVVPHLTALYPRASGHWHVRHGIEIQPLGKPAAAHDGLAGTVARCQNGDAP